MLFNYLITMSLSAGIFVLVLKDKYEGASKAEGFTKDRRSLLAAFMTPSSALFFFVSLSLSLSLSLCLSLCLYLYLYIYIHIYICCEVIIVAKFDPFQSQYFGQVKVNILAKVIFAL